MVINVEIIIIETNGNIHFYVYVRYNRVSRHIYKFLTQLSNNKKRKKGIFFL